MFKGIWLIFRKEMWTAFRERRTLLFLFLFPILVWPSFTVLPVLLIGGREKKAAEETSKVVLVSSVETPELTKLLRTSDRIRLVNVEDPSTAVEEKEADCVLYVDSVSLDSLLIHTRLRYDGTRTESKVATNKVELLLSQYEQRVVNQRLVEEGVDEKLLSAVSSRRENVIADTQMMGYFMGLVIGMFIVMGAIMGAASIIIDSTAGEKERKSLELLLTVPIPRSSIMLGKYLAGVTFAFISPILTALGMSLAASFIIPVFASNTSAGLDLSAVISVEKILMILLIVLIMAAFIVALLMAISVRARSNRQAQTFLAPLNIIVVIPVLFLQIIPAVPPTWMFAIPFLNVMLTLRGLLMDTLPPTAFIFTLASNFVFLALALRSAAKGFGSERVLLK